MNVKGLTEKFEERKTIIGNFQGYAVWWEDVKEIFEQLDEPKLVKVPQFVADWITHSKNIGRSLFGAMSIFEENFEIKKWMQWAENQETFALAWIFGYEVEEEKRYYVRFKWIEESYSYLTLIKHLHAWTLKNITLDKKIRTAHTLKELEEAGFGWVFDCPGIEVEEVDLCH